ncbi:MAG: hypothetical protein WC700_17350 [Gemmatimonadaceae bacterium]|jgi:hypothetical protein
MARTTVKQVLTRANINDVGDVLVKVDLGNVFDGGNVVAAEALSIASHIHTFANAELRPISVTVTTTGGGATNIAYGIITGANPTVASTVRWTPGSGSTPGSLLFLAADAVTGGFVAYEKKPANINANLPV